MRKRKVATKAARTTKGLGDLVEKVAKPIAKAIDKVVGTDIEHCDGCDKRKDFLNRLSGSIIEKFGYRPYMEPTEEELDKIVQYFENQGSKSGKQWQKELLPLQNKLFYRKDRPTSCAPCWGKVALRLKIIYDAYVGE